MKSTPILSFILYIKNKKVAFPTFKITSIRQKNRNKIKAKISTPPMMLRNLRKMELRDIYMYISHFMN